MPGQAAPPGSAREKNGAQPSISLNPGCWRITVTYGETTGTVALKVLGSYRCPGQSSRILNGLAPISEDWRIKPGS